MKIMKTAVNLRRSIALCRSVEENRHRGGGNLGTWLAEYRYSEHQSDLLCALQSHKFERKPTNPRSLDIHPFHSDKSDV